MAIDYPISLPSSPAPRMVEWSPMSAVAMFASPFTFSEQIQEHQGQLLRARVEYPSMDDEVAEDWIAAILSLKGMRGTFLFGDSIRKTPRGVAGGTPLVKGADQTGEVLLTDGWPALTANVLKKGDWIQLGGAAQVPFLGTPTWLTDLFVSESTFNTIKISFSDPCPPGGGFIHWRMGSLADHQEVDEGAISVTITHSLALGPARIYRCLKNIDTDASGNATLEIWPRLRSAPADNEPLVLNDTKGTFRLASNDHGWVIDRVRRYGFDLDVVEARSI